MCIVSFSFKYTFNVRTLCKCIVVIYLNKRTEKKVCSCFYSTNLPSSLKTCLSTDLNVGSTVPAVLSTCTLDFTTSAGKIATHNATPPKPPDIIVLRGPVK